MKLGNRNNVASASQVPRANIRRSTFNHSKTIKDTYQFDYLQPLWWEEVLPGDDWNVTVASFARLATQIVPILDNMYVDFFFFFVPNRLTYDKWEQLQGANIPDPDSSTDYIMPKMTFINENIVGSIFDKYGLPTGPSLPYTIDNTLPLRAYNLIWNEWFRDENLQDSVPVPKDEGPDAPVEFQLLKRGKRHDYFTSALPWPQKGPAVSLPLGVAAPVWAQGDIPVAPDGTVPSFKNNGGMAFSSSLAFNTSAGQNVQWTGTPTGVTGTNMLWNNAGLEVTQGAMNSGGPGGSSIMYADLTDASAATINQLRQAFLMQQLFERDARGGTRYVEALRARFNVISPDYRLQRPEYLGGGSVTINLHPVASTAATDDAPQANLASFGTAASTPRDGIGFRKSFTEHGYVIGLICPRADITYQQGLDKKWSRSTRFDFFEPSLEQLGEQAILQKEIFITGNPVEDEKVFGYQERWGEYRYSKSEIRGQFRSDFATTLDFWHLAQEFSAPPVLNESFIMQSTPIERAIATPTEPHLLFDGWIKAIAARPMSVVGIPAKLGRF